jgi:hypothetical protein
MRSLKLTWWLIGFAALAWVSVVRAAALPQIIIVRAPVEVTIDDPCTGETVDLNGELHLNVSLVVDGNGGIHAKSILLVANLSGVGETSGLVYHAVIKSPQVVSISGSGFPLEATQTATVNLLSQGSADNLIAQITLHLTINPAGESTAELAHAMIGCPG